MPVVARSDEEALLGTDRAAPALRLGRLAAPTLASPHSTGLYHVAWLHPSRAALAATVRRALEAGWRFEGASDHGVSEAFYLSDPDGLGVELYADRPRERWAPAPDGHGLDIYTLPLDVEDVLAQATASARGADRSGHGRRARAPEGRGRAAGGRLLRRRARLRGAGAATLRRVPRRGRLPPPRRAELVAERGRGAAAGQCAGPATRGVRARRRRGARRARALARGGSRGGHREGERHASQCTIPTGRCSRSLSPERRPHSSRPTSSSDKREARRGQQLSQLLGRGGARERREHGGLREQPRERDSRRRDAVRGRDLLERVEHREAALVQVALLDPRRALALHVLARAGTCR